MVARTLRRVLNASRPPRPTSILEATLLPHPPPEVAIGVGGSLDIALSLLPWEPYDPALLIPATSTNAAPDSTSMSSVARWLSRTSDVTIGLNSNNPTKSRTIARSQGSRIVDITRAGYTRIVFGERSLILDYADYPTEVITATRPLILVQSSGGGALSAWMGIVHPSTALRARLSGNASIELAVPVPAGYLIAGCVGNRWLVAFASTAITAELVARAAERLPQRRRGVETIGPWEDPGVQHLAELGEATSLVVQLATRIRFDDNASAQVGHEIAEMLGWKTRIVVGEAEDKQ